MTDNKQNNDISTNAQQKPIELVRKFELAIYNEDIDDMGKPKYKQVVFERPIVVEAKNPKELNDKLSLYKDAGQIAKVVREIDPPSKDQIEAYLNQTQASNGFQTNTIKVVENQQRQPTECHHVQNVQTTICNSAPKYYKVGDIEIKDDSGKIYQKQWMKLSDSEAANIRLINDKNNALVNINGKHFEIKKWVLVETSDTDESAQLEENLK